ncbi:MAG: hypothetical protein P1U34_12480 [Coxiellaceae bacterium]|nr:hypothetical protein [Coxiellaceae bacterium]
MKTKPTDTDETAQAKIQWQSPEIMIIKSSHTDGKAVNAAEACVTTGPS